MQREVRWICVYQTIQRWTFVFVVLLAVGYIAERQARGQIQPPDNRQNIVHGTVVNAVTHEPIGRALVYSPDNRFATLTDSEGHFEFTLPQASTDGEGAVFLDGQGDVIQLAKRWRPSWLMARKPGFLDDPNERGEVEASPGRELTISLVPEGLIKGRVTLPAGDTVRGIAVEMLFRQVQNGTPRWIQGGSVVTNSKGEFRFAELQPGTYKLLTREWMDSDATVPGSQLYGFPPVYYPSATDFAAAATIQLAAGQTFQADFSLVRHSYYPVKIPVTNTEPNGGMHITVSPQGQRGPGYSLSYNRAKEAIDGQLPDGKYLVEAASYGPNSPNFSATGSVNITVAGAPVEGASMVLARNNSISVNVKEEFASQQDSDRQALWSDGKHTYPLHGPRLDLQITAEAIDDFGAQRHGSIRPPTGPNDDSLVLESLAPGRYWLRLTANHGYVASATMGGTDLLREPLVVVPGASTPIDITMRDDNAELEGTVLGVSATLADSGRSAPLGYVYCIPLPDSPGQFLELDVSADGKFDYQMVAPGTYRVLAFKNPQRDLPYRDPEAMKLYETKGQVVHFAPGQKVSLQLEIVSSVE
jgi:hypothetical protein